MIKLTFYRQIWKDQIIELLPVRRSIENRFPYFDSNILIWKIVDKEDTFIGYVMVHAHW